MAMGVAQELCFSTLAIHLCSIVPLLLPICWFHFFLKAICSFYNALSKYIVSKLFFSASFSWTQIVVLLLHSNSIFLGFFFFFGMRQNVMQRWDIWVKVQWKPYGLCALLLQAPWKHCLLPQGLEKTSWRAPFLQNSLLHYGLYCVSTLSSKICNHT